MNRLTMIATLLAAALLLPPAAVAAESDVPAEAAETLPKDVCLLYLVQCENRVLSLQDKIDRLSEEIAKGTRAYSVEELHILQKKLKEANRILDMLMDYRD